MEWGRGAGREGVALSWESALCHGTNKPTAPTLTWKGSEALNTSKPRRPRWKVGFLPPASWDLAGHSHRQQPFKTQLAPLVPATQAGQRLPR